MEANKHLDRHKFDVKIGKEEKSLVQRTEIDVFEAKLNFCGRTLHIYLSK
jgi:hypothetical protein